jgi:hypothetical protein
MLQDLEEMIQFMELQENVEKSTAKAKAQNNGSQHSNQNGSTSTRVT